MAKGVLTGVKSKRNELRAVLEEFGREWTLTVLVGWAVFSGHQESGMLKEKEKEN